MRLCRPIPQEDRLPEQGKILLLNHPVQKMWQAAPEFREKVELSREAAREHQQAAQAAAGRPQAVREHRQEAVREHRRVQEEAAEQFLVEAPEHRQRPEAAQQLRKAAREFPPHQGRWLNENSRAGAGRL